VKTHPPLAWWLVAAALIGVAATFLFIPALQYDFVWDDRSLILRDVRIRSWGGVVEAFGSDFFRNSDEKVRYGYYRPLITVTYALDFWIWRDNPLGYHLTNILLHVACCFGVMALAKRLQIGLGVTSVITLLFAVHPLHTESVTWVAGRTDVVATMFAIPYLLWFDHRLTRMRVLAHVSFVAAILSKEVTLAVPGVAFCLASISSDISFKDRLKLVLPAVPLLAGYLALRATIVPMMPSMGAPTGFVEHTIGPLGALTRYLDKLFVPDLAEQSAYLQVPVSDTLADPWAAMGLAIILLAVYLWLTYRTVGLLAFAVLLSFIPMANIVRVAAPFDMGFAMSERFLYLPSLVVTLFIGVAWTRIVQPTAMMGKRAGKVAAAMAAVVMIGTLSAKTHARNPVWKDEAAMFSDARTKTKNAPLLNWLYAGVLRREGKLEAAHQLLLDAVRIARRRDGQIPAQMIITLANTTASKGQVKRAIQVLNRYTRETDNKDPMIFYNLGVLQVEQGRLGSAVKSLDYACEHRPNYLPAFLARGLLHMRRGRHSLALQSFEHIIGLDPRHPGAWHGIGMAHRGLGNTGDAVDALLNAVQYEPAAINPRIDAAALLIETDPDRALALIEMGMVQHPDDERLSKAAQFIRAELGQTGGLPDE